MRNENQLERTVRKEDTRQADTRLLEETAPLYASVAYIAAIGLFYAALLAAYLPAEERPYDINQQENAYDAQMR